MEGSDDIAGRIFTILICWFFAAVNLKLIAESHQWGNGLQIITNLAALIALILLLFSVDYLQHFWFLLPGLLLLLTVAPHIGRPSDDAAMCHFNTALVIAIVFAIIAMLILCGGLSAILASLHYLFEVRIDSDFYADIWMVGAALFAPLYTLSGIPREFDVEATDKNYPKGVKFIVSYILAPLAVCYLAILYAYIIKIIVLWELPKGNLAYMISGFGAVGIVSHLFAYPLRDSGHLLLRLVCRYFYPALIAPVILLFVAILVRISEYGFTEQRYAVLLLAVWLGISALYVAFTGTRKLKLVPMMLALLLVAASFGPWGAVYISGKSQVMRLATLLENENILVEDKIIKATEEPELDTLKQISSIVSYITKSKKQELIAHWFPEDSVIHEKKRHYSIAQDLMKEMGLRYVSRWENGKSRTTYFHLKHGETGNVDMIDVHMFDYVFYNKDVYLQRRDGWEKIFNLGGTEGQHVAATLQRRCVYGNRP